MNRLTLMAMLALAGCTTPVQYSQGPMTRLDKDTEYRVEDQKNGFQLIVSYSAYTFLAESSAMLTMCRNTITSLAHDIAEKRGRKIKPVAEQRIRTSLGYNGITGVSSCSATAPVEWQ